MPFNICRRVTCFTAGSFLSSIAGLNCRTVEVRQSVPWDGGSYMTNWNDYSTMETNVNVAQTGFPQAGWLGIGGSIATAAPMGLDGSPPVPSRWSCIIAAILIRAAPTRWTLRTAGQRGRSLQNRSRQNEDPVRSMGDGLGRLPRSRRRIWTPCDERRNLLDQCDPGKL
jgi:hypothetical protein